MASREILTGYGPSFQWQNLTFDGDERKCEIWEVKTLGYMKLRTLKETLVGTDAVDQNKNKTAFAELILFLDECLLSLVIRGAKDDGRKAFKMLWDFYAGSSKPRAITLYNQLTTLVKRELELVTDYMIHTEKAADEQLNGVLLLGMTLIGLPDETRLLSPLLLSQKR